jgi:release factor glutamine methyltransferase
MTVDEGTVTWATLWADTTVAVGDRQHARWICEVAAGVDDPDEFLGRIDEPATERMVAHLDAMVARRRSGEPLQYVLGEWGFRRLTLAVDPRVLIPRPETEFVAGVAIELVTGLGAPRTVADLGTGSGAIGLSIAVEAPETDVWITDVDPDVLDVARSNLAGIGTAAARVRVGEGSWFEALPAGTAFDLVVSNPPYVAEGSPEIDPSVTEWEPTRALFAGADGLDDIRALVAGAGDVLRPGGWLVLEIGADQGDVVAGLLRAGGWVEVEIRPDLAGRDRVAVARRPT